jgi:hypothetical protein
MVGREAGRPRRTRTSQSVSYLVLSGWLVSNRSIEEEEEEEEVVEEETAGKPNKKATAASS